jgi:hypothetical protein
LLLRYANEAIQAEFQLRAGRAGGSHARD